MSIQDLLTNYNIPFVTEGHKRNTEGWINIHCPFCPGSKDFHLGIHEDGNGCHCWRCGGHTMVELLTRLLGVSEAEARSLLRKYKGGVPRKRIVKTAAVIFPIKLPSPNTPLKRASCNYLRQRGYKPKALEKEWSLRQTGPMSLLDGMLFNNRIIIPIYWNGDLVSFQARDISGESPYKYLACPKNREKRHHKNILYGKQESLIKAKRIIVVEGVTDVWRFGPCSTATFGIKFKMEQILQLSRLGNQFAIIFDNEPQAQRQARKLQVKLRTLGKDAVIEQIPDDPGNMPQEEADYLVRQLQK